MAKQYMVCGEDGWPVLNDQGEAAGGPFPKRRAIFEARKASSSSPGTTFTIYESMLAVTCEVRPASVKAA